MNDGRISLTSDFQFKMYEKSMDVLRRHCDALSQYNKGLFEDLEDGYAMAGRSMTLTVKQMNHLKTLAMELEQKYG